LINPYSKIEVVFYFFEVYLTFDKWRKVKEKGTE